MRTDAGQRGGFSELTFEAMQRRLRALAGEGVPVALLIHARPDGDCVGSAYAMAVLLGKLGCRCRIICADKLPERLRFIADTICRDCQSEISADSAEAEFAPGSGCAAITLDVAAPSQLGYDPSLYDIRLGIDHHASSTKMSDRFMDPSASATGEIVWRIAREWARKGLTGGTPKDAAGAVYAAISSDTGCFRYSNVTPATHRVAAQLVSLVPFHADIDRLLFDTKTPGRLAAERAALEVLQLHCNGRVAVCPMSREKMREYGIIPEELDALIDTARSVAGVEVAFSVREESDGYYRVSSRSNCDIDVAAICSNWGGGGHVRAAGCTVSADGIDEAVEKLILATAEKLV